MPKSRRDKDVSLTKVKKKGAERKQKLIDEIRKCIGSYEHIFVFSIANMRNNKLKDVRQDFKADSRFFFGKNKVTAIALGRIAEEEFAENLHRISKRLIGQTGLLFTNKPKDEVISYFKELAVPDFSRAGVLASETIEFEAGPMLDMPHSLEPQLRKLGMPSSLDKGVLVLLKDHTVCQKGEVLTPEQAKILKILGIRQSIFQVNLECVWTKTEAKFESFTKKLQKKSTGKKTAKKSDENKVEN